MDFSPALAALALCVPLAAQTTIHVPGDAATVQGGIELAEDGDTVLVGPGTFTGVIDFLGKAITVRGAGPALTVIDGGDGSLLPAVSFHQGEGEDSVLRDVTVTGGDNRFSDVWGGGVSCMLPGVNTGTPTLKNCVITGNVSAATPGAGVAGDARLEDCVVSNNSFLSEMWGAGLWGSPVLKRCVVSGNQAYEGAGIFLTGGSGTLVLEDVVVTGNVAGPSPGGGIRVARPGVVLRRCLIAGNVGVGFGGQTVVTGAGLQADPGSAPVLERCTVVDNTILFPGQFGDNFGGVGGFATLVDCIVRGNDTNQLAPGCPVTYSDVQGGYPGLGNIDADPLFVDAVGGDYHLQAGSPCLDAGDPTHLDPDATRADMGAFFRPNASAFIVNGNFVNRLGFAGVTEPVPGTTWIARIASGPHPGVLACGFTIVDRARAPLLLPGLGELLIDTTRPRLASPRKPASGGLVDFSTPLPADQALYGLTLHAQAFVFGGGIELLNALELHFGF